MKGQSTRYTYCALPNCLAEVTIDARDEFGVAKWMIVYDILDELKQQASSARYIKHGKFSRYHTYIILDLLDGSVIPLKSIIF